MKYRIYEDFYKDVEKKINRIGKKCSRYGNDFVFNVVGTDIEEIEDKESHKKYLYRFIIVDVEGTAKINNYECVAVLNIHNNGNIIRRINTEIEIPERFKFTKNICEHCNSNRRRNNLYIIHNVETNEFKQVGSDCLELYTNGLNAEYVASFIDGVTELEEFDGFIGSGEKRYIPVEDVVSCAYDVISKIGYFNSSCDCATKYIVGKMLFDYNFNKNIYDINLMLNNHGMDIKFEKEDFYKEETKVKSKQIIKYYMSLKDDCEFIHNVQVLLKDGYASCNDIGFLCYLPEGYNRYIKKENERKERIKSDKKSNYFGEINKRYKELNVYNMSVITEFETLYGTMYVYKITLKSGDILIWKTTKWIDKDYIDKACYIDFTVKAHTEYCGVKQTEITRCKLKYN